MKKNIVLILMLLLLAASVSAQVNYYYKIGLVYSYGDVTYETLAIEPSQTELKTPEGTHIAEVVSFENEVLDTIFFDFSRLIFVDTVNPETGELEGGGTIELDESEVILYVPYYEKAKEINIYDWDLNEKLSIEVSEFSKEIPEGVIEAKEVEERELEKVEEEVKKAPVWMWVLAGLGLLVVIFIIGVLLSLKKRKKSV